jgi:putative tryptophan/tyrosine transport system substrate-binding protein
MPVIGVLEAGGRRLIRAEFHKGLAETGFVEGRNVIMEHHFAEGRYEQLPALAAELVHHRVSVIVAIPSTAALAAKAATTTIPIVFLTGFDAVRIGLVRNLNRPGGNITGISYLSATLGTKRLEFLHQLVPNAALIAALMNPTNANYETELEDIKTAARILGLKLTVVEASSDNDIGIAFTAVVQQRADALIVGGDAFLALRTSQISELATRHSIPAMYQNNDATDAGGLISYGASRAEYVYEAGIYAGRILKGDKPAALPVLQPTKFELVINLKTAKAMGLEIPPGLLAIADEVIQ